MPEAGFGELARLQFSTALPVMTAAPGTGVTASEPSAGERPVPAFGEKGSWRWNLTGGFAAEFDDTQNRFGRISAGISYFMIDDLSLELELNALYFDQEGDNALGAGFNLLARWHVVAKEHWSMYLDGGGGLLAATERVPAQTADSAGGSRFGFTPQAGLGLSYEIAENTRMLLGVRWHHISNARTRRSNPPRNSLLIYAGVSFPF